MMKKTVCILIDKDRNMPIGRFDNTKQALTYAKEEGILKMTWEIVEVSN